MGRGGKSIQMITFLPPSGYNILSVSGYKRQQLLCSTCAVYDGLRHWNDLSVGNTWETSHKYLHRIHIVKAPFCTLCDLQIEMDGWSPPSLSSSIRLPSHQTNPINSPSNLSDRPGFGFVMWPR
ncbi:hypothetical protein TNCV_1328921 [Trichonephila clavipes]|nr:hypothetical protein TNCV_1328921 [Trichonephila clavipes]